MNYDEIVQYLCDKGYGARLGEFCSLPCLIVSIDIDGNAVELTHFQTDTFSYLPQFYLNNYISFGQLSHVLKGIDSSLGFICVGDKDSVSVNYEQPHLAMEESVRRNIDLIRRNLTDPDWNEKELLREFHANWVPLQNTSDPRLICAAQEGTFDVMQVYRPIPGSKYGYGAQYIGISENVRDLAEFSYIAREKNNQKRSCLGEGVVIPIANLAPAPVSREQLPEWYLNTLHNLSSDIRAELDRYVARRRAKEHWVVFNGETPSGRVWFGLYFKLKNKGKKTLPVREESLSSWQVGTIILTTFSKERLMPRGGASTSLSEKSILLVGCGSVGGEIAHKLATAGIGQIHLADPDVYSLDNVYRHVLDPVFIGYYKSRGLCFDIESKYPWTKCTPSENRLLELRSKTRLEKWDLIVIAIGAPTHERQFHDFIVDNDVSVPVINTWLEGYGIGGHATLDLPVSKGCLRCAYVDQESLGRGLSSNMNFLEANQTVTVNHAGCGDLFLPYGAISAAQTALITAGLAVQFLNGSVTESCRLSWKGGDTDAVNAGLLTTHRYRAFSKSLQRTPLYDEHCYICNA